MHLCFVDESGTPSKFESAENTTFVIGGVIIPDTVWHNVHKKLEHAKSSWKYTGEIKWRFFAPTNSDHDNPMKEWSPENKDAFRTSIFNVITSQSSIKILACVCDCKKAYEKLYIKTQDEIYFGTYKPITERFQYFLQDLTRQTGSKQTGIIVADQRSSKNDNKLRNQHERLINKSSNTSSNYSNLIESLFFSPSHMSVGIQLADMVAGATWRYFAKNDPKFFDQIRPSFRSSPSGEIRGHGLITFPKS